MLCCRTEVFCPTADDCQNYVYYNNGYNYDSVQHFYTNVLHQPKLITFTYHYLTHKKNTLGNQNFGMPFFGKSSYSLADESFVKFRQFITPTADINAFDTLSYQYEFDVQGRVIKRVNEANPYFDVPEDSLTTYYTYY